jgi:hypothetical protein
MNNYPISTESKHNEMQLINTILHGNGYPSQTHIHKKIQFRNTTSNTTQKQKWTTFTYIDNETRTITRLFKNTNLRIAYKTTTLYETIFNLRTTDKTTDKIQPQWHIPNKM